MIRLTLQLTPQSTVSAGPLWAIVLPDVINAVLARGYTLAGTSASGLEQPHQFTASYQLEPGPPTLTAEADHDGGPDPADPYRSHLRQSSSRS